VSRETWVNTQNAPLRARRRASVPFTMILAVSCLAAPLAGQSAVGSAATPITLTDLDGKAMRLDAKAAGKPMLIEFWATWCEVCEALLPSVRRAATRFGGQVDFVGVNVTVNESRSRVRRWVERERPPYRTLYDESGLAVRTFQAPVTSYVVIIDASGIIRYTGVGEEQDLIKALEGVVGK
jgi:cytochrome c biogenesis protein CcmG/thiol:disulfide interchange protein DsbE